MTTIALLHFVQFKTNERKDGRTDESTNESMLARLLDESCFVVCRTTVQTYLVIVVVKV